MRIKRVVETRKVKEYLESISKEERREYSRMKKAVEVNPIENTKMVGLKVDDFYSLISFKFGPHVAVCTYDLAVGILCVRRCCRVRP